MWQSLEETSKGKYNKMSVNDGGCLFKGMWKQLEVNFKQDQRGKGCEGIEDGYGCVTGSRFPSLSNCNLKVL
jgi:hypothetical protein